MMPWGGGGGKGFEGGPEPVGAGWGASEQRSGGPEGRLAALAGGHAAGKMLATAAAGGRPARRGTPGGPYLQEHIEHVPVEEHHADAALQGGQAERAALRLGAGAPGGSGARGVGEAQAHAWGYTHDVQQRDTPTLLSTSISLVSCHVPPRLPPPPLPQPPWHLHQEVHEARQHQHEPAVEQQRRQPAGDERPDEVGDQAGALAVPGPDQLQGGRGAQQGRGPVGGERA